MSTISRKNPQIMASKFIKDYKQFESYLKHCINILQSQVWLKDNQFNNQISDYDYMNEFFYKNGSNPYSLMQLYAHYKKDVIDNFPAEKLIKVATNKYYPDVLSNFVQSLSGFEKDNLLISNLPENRKKIFKRLFYLIFSEEINFDKNYEYSENEILELIENGKALAVESGVEIANITEAELLRRIFDGKIDFVNRDFSGGYMFSSNTGDIIDLFEAENEEERRAWFLKNQLFVNYVRKNKLEFNRTAESTNVIACHYSFDETANHIDRIIANVNKQLKHKKTVDVEKYKKLINSILEEKETLKASFDSDSPVIEILPEKE